MLGATSWRATSRAPFGRGRAGRSGRASNKGRARGGVEAWRRGLVASDEGQATIEAAMLLPTLMILMALLVQPACLLYTRCVMQAAAAEACRLVATNSQAIGTVEAAQRSYVLRRLQAVPDIPIFHEGGDDGWLIELSGSTSSHEASARIVTTARPLPFVGVLAGLLGQTDESGGVILEVRVSVITKPDWVEGGYGDWSSIW